jgi:hypothetical protein
MESFLQNYLDKCEDYSVTPKQRFLKELKQGIEKQYVSECIEWFGSDCIVCVCY